MYVGLHLPVLDHSGKVLAKMRKKTCLSTTVVIKDH